MAARISYESIAFPVGPHIEEEDVQRIVETVGQVVGRAVARA